MSEPLKRRSLLGALDTPPAALPDEVVEATAARSGFVTAAPVARPNIDAAAGPRRRRLPTGRDHQFNVRLRIETLEAIYALANGRNIPVAQVIEEAMRALAKHGGG